MKIRRKMQDLTLWKALVGMVTLVGGWLYTQLESYKKRNFALQDKMVELIQSHQKTVEEIHAKKAQENREDRKELVACVNEFTRVINTLKA